jgi:hypothetical protein
MSVMPITSRDIRLLAAAQAHDAVAKHGSGDQSAHGNWAHGAIGEAAALVRSRAGLGKKLRESVLGKGGRYHGGTAWDDAAISPLGLARIVQAQGWDKPSPHVSEEDFRQLEKTGDYITMYRGGPIGLERGMIEGTPFVGDGLSGVGTYVTKDPSRAENFAKKVKTGGSVVPMLVPRSMVEDGHAWTEHIYEKTHGRRGSGDRGEDSRRWLGLFKTPSGKEAREDDSASLHAIWGKGIAPSTARAGVDDYVLFNTGAVIVGQPRLIGDRK